MQRNTIANREIGEETHDDVDQFFRFEEGECAVIIDGVKHAVKDGSSVVVPSGAKHNIVNTSKVKNLKMYTMYSPPEHKDKVVRKTKQEAMAKRRALRRETDGVEVTGPFLNIFFVHVPIRGVKLEKNRHKKGGIPFF